MVAALIILVRYVHPECLSMLDDGFFLFVVFLSSFLFIIKSERKRMRMRRKATRRHSHALKATTK